MNDEALRIEGTAGADADDDREPPLRPENLRGADLRGKDLTKIKGLLPEHLAGAALTGAKLPDEIAKFQALAQVKEISADARKIFIGLLAACVYSWLVIGTTRDVDLILNTASSPLPIINSPVPIAYFYVVGAALLSAVYCYLHFYLQRLWRMLSTLPAVFPDGTPLDDKTDPWLLTNLVRTDFAYLRASAPPLARLENLLTIVLAWWLVPLTLVGLWVRYLPAHYTAGLVWLAFLIAATAFFGVHSFRLARATLRGDIPRASGELTDDRPGSLVLRILRDARHIRPEQALFAFVVPCALLTAASFSVVLPSPRYAPFNGARFLNDIGIRTYADLREVEVAERPDGWTGEDWRSVRRVDLRGRNLAFAEAAGSFLANADLRGANLTGATLERAELQGALFYDEDRGEGVRLRGADLAFAQLQDSNLAHAELQGANLTYAQLHGADLAYAQLQGAVLRGARLQGTDLWKSSLLGAFLGGAQLHGAYLAEAELQGAVLISSQLQGAFLREAQLQGINLNFAELQGADLRGTAIWRASVDGAVWEFADVRSPINSPMNESDIDALISRATKGIPDQQRREAVTDELTAALRPANDAAGTELPEEWRSNPNVMFELRWDDYDRRLAYFLYRLACDHNAPEEQTRGLARRALGTPHPLILRSREASLVPIWMGGPENDRLWPKIFARHVTGPDCPPAKGLPGDMRRQLEQLAARGDAAASTAEAVPPDPPE